MKFLLATQMIVTLFMIGVILMQKSEGGGLGMGSSSNNMFTARGTANVLTRITAILAAVFMALCLLMTWLNRHNAHHSEQILHQAPVSSKE